MKAIIKIILPVLMLIMMGTQLKAQYVTNSAGKFNGTNSCVSFFGSSDVDLRGGYTIEAWVYYEHVQGTQKLIYFDTAGVLLSINSNGNVSF